MTDTEIPYWYAAYTNSRAEKKVALELEKKGIEHYLPLVSTIRQWKDRRKKVLVPLIRSYIFLRIKESEYRTAIKTPGIVNIVHFAGKPAVIPEWQITNLKILMDAEMPFTNEDQFFEKGEEVSILHGPLQGLKGRIVDVKGAVKLVVSVEALNYCLTVDIDKRLVVKI